MIIFLEDMTDEKSFTAVKTACRSIGLIKVEEDAREMQVAGTGAASSNSGAYILSTRYGRGYDFKLQKDAHVFVLMNGDQLLTLADVKQMAGRGNRSQGTLSATIIMAKPFAGANCEDVLEANAKRYTTEVLNVLKRVYKTWPTLNDKH